MDNYNYPPGSDTKSAPWNQMPVNPTDVELEEAENGMNNDEIAQDWWDLINSRHAIGSDQWCTQATAMAYQYEQARNNAAYELAEKREQEERR